MIHELLIPGIFIFTSFVTVMILVPKFADSLKENGMIVRDVNKKIETWIPRPVSLPLLLGFLISETLLFVLFQNVVINMIIAVAMISFVIGFFDDLKPKKGWFKPVLLMSGVVPILAFQTFESELIFPVVGGIDLPFIVYLIPLVAMIPVFANTVNSIDVVNGSVSGIMTVSGLALVSILAISGEIELALIAIPLPMISLAFYYYHKVPSKVFPGDSGTLMLGAIYAGFAITGNIEVYATIILAPLILNSFLFLTSVRKIVEHREIKNPPVVHTGDFKIADSEIKTAPMTLVRCIVKQKPLTESQISKIIIKLNIISSLIAIGLVLIS